MSFQIVIQPPDTNSNWTAFNRECDDLNSDFLMQPINEADYDSETQACVDLRSEEGPRSFYDHYVTRRRKKKGVKGLGVEHPARYGMPEEEAAATGRVLRVTPTESVGFGGGGDGRGRRPVRRRVDGKFDNEEPSSASPSDGTASSTTSASEDSTDNDEGVVVVSSSSAAAAAVGVKASSIEEHDAGSCAYDADTPSAGGAAQPPKPKKLSLAAQRTQRRLEKQKANATAEAAAAVAAAVTEAPSPSSSSRGTNHQQQNSNFLCLPTNTTRGGGGLKRSGGIASAAASAMPPPPAVNPSIHPDDFLDIPNRIVASKGALNNAAIRRIACGRHPTPVWNAPTGFRSDGVNAYDTGAAKSAAADASAAVGEMEIKEEDVITCSITVVGGGVPSFARAVDVDEAVAAAAAAATEAAQTEVNTCTTVTAHSAGDEVPAADSLPSVDISINVDTSAVDAGADEAASDALPPSAAPPAEEERKSDSASQRPKQSHVDPTATTI